MKQNRILISVVALSVFAFFAWLSVTMYLSNSFSKGPTDGPFTANGMCPVFEPNYRTCEVQFGNQGLSTLNSFYETFVGEGAFEISSFEIESMSLGRFNITAQSNRGPIKSEIYTDRLVRLGQDREDEVVYLTNQSAFCDSGRIYEHQAVYRDGKLNVQELEYWTENDQLRFRLFQNGAPTADVICRP